MISSRFIVSFPLWCLFILQMSCGANKPVDPDWKSKAAVQVLRLRWVKNLAPEAKNFLIPDMVEEYDRFDPIETGAAGFDTDRRRAFIGASTGGLYCLDLRSADTIWRFDLDDPVGSKPIYDSERKYVYFGADDGKFYALHARSGRKIWEFDTGAEIRRTSFLREDTLYIVNADNTVFAADPQKGEIIWQYRRPPIEGFSSAGYASIVFHGDKLLTGFNDGYVAALNPVAGTVIWSHDLAAELVSMSKDGSIKLVDSDATPVVEKGILIAASVNGGLQGLDVDTGPVRWIRSDITEVTGLAGRLGVVYAARSSFGMTAIDPTDGKELWTKRFRAGMLLDPVIHDDVLIVSDSEYGLLVLSSLDGRLLQRVDPRKGFFARPSLYGGYLLVLGNYGHLYAMSIL